MCWLVTVFSPMAWTQNFILLLPLLAFLVPRMKWSERTIVTLFALYFASTQLVNYDFVGRHLYEASVHIKLVLWASVLLVFAACLKMRARNEITLALD